MYKMLFVTFFFRNFCFTSRPIAKLLTVTADRIARVIKTSGATHTVVLDISSAFYRAWHNGILYKFRLCGVMKRCFILLSHFVVVKEFELFWSTSHLLSDEIPKKFLSDILCFEWANESQIRLYEKLKTLSTGWKVLKLPFFCPRTSE